MSDYVDIKPITPPIFLDKVTEDHDYLIEKVSPIIGMATSFIRKATGKKKLVNEKDILFLLELDAFTETFVPRSKVLQFLRKQSKKEDKHESFSFKPNTLYQGDALDLIQKLDDHSIKCVVTSTPYWAMRIYDGNKEREWADGEICPFGLEQTPEGFIRHAVEVLYYLLPKLDDEGSIWWNVMDSYNTRTQIRESASEALSAMKGLDSRSWKDYKYKRYSSGHFYLKDGEQCQIPQRIAMRASQLGYYLKSTISWCKTASMPEPQLSRVSRNVEYILHLSKQRTPIFNKSIYLKLPP
ncbi:DNA methyltransferase, partial [Ileibacterium valens]